MHAILKCKDTQNIDHYAYINDDLVFPSDTISGECNNLTQFCVAVDNLFGDNLWRQIPNKIVKPGYYVSFGTLFPNNEYVTSLPSTNYTVSDGTNNYNLANYGYSGNYNLSTNSYNDAYHYQPAYGNGGYMQCPTYRYWSCNSSSGAPYFSFYLIVNTSQGLNTSTGVLTESNLKNRYIELHYNAPAGNRSGSYYIRKITLTSDIIKYSIAYYYIELPKTINTCTITLPRTVYEYTGERIEPEPKVYDSTRLYTLVKSQDYSLAYTNNLNIGTATINITGSGEYTGSQTINFNIISTDDPFTPGGTSNIGGGDGSFDSTSDSVSIPALPSLSALDTGLVNLWAPTSLQLSSLVSWLWSSAFDLESFKKLFSNPMDLILGLSIVPVSVPTTTSTVKFGNIDSEISMYKVTQQYAIVDCGDINIESFWGSYLDYSPYTKISIYLPYIGFEHIDPDLIMDSTINVTYHVDVLSGACVAFITSNDNVLYTFMGNCSTQVPISSRDWAGVYASMASIIGNSATYAIGGANVGGIAGGVAGAAIGAASSMVTTSMKPVIGNSGTISSAGGLLDIQKPFVIINRPRQALPERQNTYTGYPAFITSPLNAVLGYTEIEEIHLDNVPATESELEEILEILKNGFII